MSTYTFTTKIPASEPNQLSNFGGMPNDANRNSMLISAGPQTSDITGTPVTSPVTVSNVVVKTLNIPLNAVRVNFVAVTNTVNISEADATVATKYVTIPTGTVVTMETARCAVLYLEANTGSSTLSFWFDVV
jgi:polyisoprenoid-binding protein YceI